MTSSKRKKILIAALRALIAGAETSALIKVPAAFISELAALPNEQLERLVRLDQKQFNELLTQIELATLNSAMSAVNTELIKALVPHFISSTTMPPFCS